MCWDIFTHGVAVHEEDTKRDSSFVQQAEEERIVSVEVVSSLQGGGAKSEW